MRRPSKRFFRNGEAGLESYLNEIADLEPLSREEERELSERIKIGDIEARNKLVTANLKFVVTVAKEYRGYGLPVRELIAAGNDGLVRAAEKFDGNRGYKFISYAVWWIRQSILSALSEQQVVRVPPSQLHVEEVINQWIQDTGKKPTLEEIAKIVGMTPQQVEKILSQKRRIQSLDASLYPDDEDNKEGREKHTLHNILEDGRQAPWEEVEARLLREDVEDSLASLGDPRQAEVLRLYFGIGQEKLTLDEIGDRFGVTRERIRQIKEKALRRLRHPKKRKKLQAHHQE